MINVESYAATVGRLLLIALFFVSAIGKLAAPAATKAYIVAKGLPFPELAFWISILVELGGGALFLIGYQTRIVALGLALYSIAANLIGIRRRSDPILASARHSLWALNAMVPASAIIWPVLSIDPAGSFTVALRPRPSACSVTSTSRPA